MPAKSPSYDYKVAMAALAGWTVSGALNAVNDQWLEGGAWVVFDPDGKAQYRRSTKRSAWIAAYAAVASALRRHPT